MQSTYQKQYEELLKDPVLHGGSRLLVVDDNVELLEELKQMFVNSGYQVETLADSQRVLPVAYILKPELILLDLKMKPKNGFQVAEDLKNSFQLKDIPIVAMTGFFTEKEHILMMKFRGIKSFILKPFDPRALIAKIEFALGHREEEYDDDAK